MIRKLEISHIVAHFLTTMTAPGTFVTNALCSSRSTTAHESVKHNLS
jgi:hypothetical protein